MARAKRKRNVPLPTLQFPWPNWPASAKLSEFVEGFKHLQPQNILKAIRENEERAKTVDRANRVSLTSEALMSRAVTALEDLRERMAALPQPKQRRPGSGRKSIYEPEVQAQILATHKKLKDAHPADMQKPLVAAALVMQELKLKGDCRRADRVIRPEHYRRHRPK